MANPTVRKIVAEWLEKNGYDGLYSPGECSCLISDLMPCDEACCECMAGFKVDCPGPDECPADGYCDFHIGEKRIIPDDIRHTNRAGG